MMEFPEWLEDRAASRPTEMDGWQDIAEWARKEALTEAQCAVMCLAYVIDTDRTAFPSQTAVDKEQALDAIKALEGADRG